MFYTLRKHCSHAEPRALPFCLVRTSGLFPRSCDLSLSAVSHLHTPLMGLSVAPTCSSGHSRPVLKVPAQQTPRRTQRPQGKNQIIFFCSLLNVCPWGLPFIPSLALYERLVVCILPDISRCFVKAAHLEYYLCCIVFGHNSFYFQTGSVVVAQKFFDRLKIIRS